MNKQGTIFQLITFLSRHIDIGGETFSYFLEECLHPIPLRWSVEMFIIEQRYPRLVKYISINLMKICTIK